MKLLHFIGCAAALVLSSGARADKMPIPADAPPAFKAECAGCHLAFPPALLAAADWKRVMAALDNHYGDNASLDDKTRLLIEDFLARNAGSARKVSAGATAARPGEPPRLTETAWFKRKHHEVPAAEWRHARVKSPSNCGACHTRADAGSFREREIVLANGRRWED